MACETGVADDADGGRESLVKAELVAEEIVDLPIGPVRLTLARHDDGHYSGIATLAHSGQRIGMLEAGRLMSGTVALDHAVVDATVAGSEVGTEMERLLRKVVAVEAHAVSMMAEPTEDKLDSSRT